MSRTFYAAVFEVLNMPMGGSADDYFWANELFVSTPDSNRCRVVDRAPSPGIPRPRPNHGGRVQQGCPGPRREGQRPAGRKRLSTPATHGNAIRPFCVGRRNWLFADTVACENASANLYSLLQTCLANGIDGYQHLTALLVELPKAKTVEDYEALLPWRLAAAIR